MQLVASPAKNKRGRGTQKKDRKTAFTLKIYANGPQFFEKLQWFGEPHDNFYN